MYVWTEKAESDWSIKYPGRKCQRVAGEQVVHEGKVVTDKSILRDYKSRGWVRNTESKNTFKGKFKRGARPLTAFQKKKRWMELKKFLQQPNRYSLTKVANALGYVSNAGLAGFVERNGVEMAEKYGKLPYIYNVRKSFWFDVMEERP